MLTKSGSYAGLMEHREVLESLCGAVLLRAVRDKAYFADAVLARRVRQIMGEDYKWEFI